MNDLPIHPAHGIVGWQSLGRWVAVAALLLCFVGLPAEQQWAARNTGLAAVLTLVIVLPLGSLLALFLFRTDLPGRWMIQAILVSQLLVPVYLQAAGWDAAFGRQGWYSYQWSTLSNPLFVGWLAVIWIQSVVLLPWVTILVGLGLRLVEPELEEMGLLETSLGQVLRHVTWRRSLPYVLVAAGWVVVSTSSDMTITDMYQVRTYAEELYIGFAQGGTLAEVGIRIAPGILITMLGVIVLGTWMVRIAPRFAPLTVKQPIVFSLGRWRWCVGLIVLLVVLVSVGVPIGSLIYKAGLTVASSGEQRLRSWSVAKLFWIISTTPGRFSSEFGWTALVGVLTASAIIGIAVPWAWWARYRAAAWWAMFLVASLGLAIPGPMVSLVVLELTSLPGPEWWTYLADRSLLPAVLALLIRVLPLPLLLTWYTLRGIPEEQLEAARLEGATRRNEWMTVILPQRSHHLLAIWLVAFVLSSGDLSVSILVTPPGISTLPTRVFGLVHAGVDDRVAGLSLVGLIVYVVIAIGVMILRRTGLSYNK